MKRPLQNQLVISLLADVASVCAAYLLSFVLRFHLEIVPVTKGIPPIGIYLATLPAVIGVWIMVSATNRLYKSQRKNSYFDEAAAVFRAGSVSTFILVALTFFYRDYTFSRVMLLLFWAASILLVTAVRIFFIYRLKARYRKGDQLTSVLVVGAGPLGQVVARKIKGLPQLGFKVLGFADDLETLPAEGAEPPPLLGGIDDIPQIIRENRVEQVFIALPRERHELMVHALRRLDKESVDIRIVPDILQFVFLKAGLENLDGIPIINLAETPLSGWYAPVKRGADIVISLLGIILFSPLFLLIAFFVKVTSRGPVLYRRERMSLDGSVFTMLKFRSMREDAEAGTGAVWTKRDDPRRTAVGTILRRTSLDELPQLVNILRGEMSFVGPRPERPVFVEQFRDKIPRYMMRHKVKCGLTGWAQVNGWRGDTSIEKRIEFDIFYIENWSLGFDLKIIWMTLWNGLINKHAY